MEVLGTKASPHTVEDGEEDDRTTIIRGSSAFLDKHGDQGFAEVAWPSASGFNMDIEVGEKGDAFPGKISELPDSDAIDAGGLAFGQSLKVTDQEINSERGESGGGR